MVTIPGIKGAHNVLKPKLSPEMKTCSSFYAVSAIAAMEALTGIGKRVVYSRKRIKRKSYENSPLILLFNPSCLTVSKGEEGRQSDQISVSGNNAF